MTAIEQGWKLLVNLLNAAHSNSLYIPAAQTSALTPDSLLWAFPRPPGGTGTPSTAGHMDTFQSIPWAAWPEHIGKTPTLQR